MKVELFDFLLPEENIALRPARPRDSARMLLVDGDQLGDKGVRDLPGLLTDKDVLVFNDTRVIPAQLEGRRGEASIGATLHKRHDLRAWWAFVRNAKRVRVGDPYVWTGIPSAVSGAYDDIQLPDVGTDIDWELELGVVIGRSAYRVSTAEALDYVAGYTIVNDLTARSLVPRDDMAKIGTDWFRAKNQPGFFPTGPSGAHGVRNETDDVVRVMMFSEVKTPAATVYPDSDKIGVFVGNEDDTALFRRREAVGYYTDEPGV